MISCLHLRPKLQQMAFLAWNQSTGNKSYGIWTTSSLAQTASFNCLGDRVAAMSVTELDVHCFLQGCPHLNIPVSLLQKGLAEILQQTDSRADPRTFSKLHYSALLLEEW